MSASASAASVRVRVVARACVFAAAVQGCSKHAGKPVTANQARENHPSAQRRGPTIPHFLCLPFCITSSISPFLLRFCFTFHLVLGRWDNLGTKGRERCWKWVNGSPTSFISSVFVRLLPRNSCQMFVPMLEMGYCYKTLRQLFLHSLFLQN